METYDANFPKKKVKDDGEIISKDKPRDKGELIPRSKTPQPTRKRGPLND